MMHGFCSFHKPEGNFFDIYTELIILGITDPIKSCSDSELVQKFKETRDNAIVGELFQRYTVLVFGVCMKYLKDEDEAKDGVMQIFEKILTDLHRHNVENFKGWLYMVAKNHCMMYFRSKKNHVELPRELTEDISEEAVFSPSGGGAGGEISVELTSDLHHNGEDKEKQLTLMESSIKELKPEQKVCVELFYLQEKSYEEVAKTTGYTMKEVKSYIQNGKRNLKILMTTAREKSK
jgi:RNA polymerase sigma factor (sigma-70 family)